MKRNEHRNIGNSAGGTAGVAMTVAGQASDISRTFIASVNAVDILRLQLRASSVSGSLAGVANFGPAITLSIIRIQ